MRIINKNFAPKKSGSQAQAKCFIATVECQSNAGREVDQDPDEDLENWPKD